MNGYDLVYTFFDVLKEEGNSVLGFVIMPRHVHLLMHYTNKKQSLNTIIENGRRFVGYGIIKRLKEIGESALLNKRKKAVTAKDRQRNKLYEVWQGTFDR